MIEDADDSGERVVFIEVLPDPFLARGLKLTVKIAIADTFIVLGRRQAPIDLFEEECAASSLEVAIIEGAGERWYMLTRVVVKCC